MVAVLAVIAVLAVHTVLAVIAELALLAVPVLAVTCQSSGKAKWWQANPVARPPPLATRVQNRGRDGRSQGP